MSEHVRIIYVCSGNICRSPMAEAMTKEMLEERGRPGVVISAGTLGIVGRKPAAFTRRALQEEGFDPPQTRSQGISPGLLEHADFIPVMEPKHAEHLLGISEEFDDKIVRLWHYADEPIERIDDPVGEEIEAFRQTRELLYECIETWLDSAL